MPSYMLIRDLDSNQCRIMYDSMATAIKSIMEKHYRKEIHCTMASMRDTSKPFSYTLLKSRTIVLNTDSKTFNLFGEAANYVMSHDANPNMHYKFLVTTMIDDVCHELHHLIIPTDPKQYMNDKAYAMVIENTVKLNTYEFLTRHYFDITRALNCEYDLEFLKIIQTQYRRTVVEPAIGYKLVRPF